MMRKRLVNVCFLTASVALSSCYPIPIPYPDEFSIHFVTNITDTETAHHPVSGKLLYSWSVKSQRIQHAAGSYECRHFYNTTKEFSLLFVKEGMYRFLDHDGNNDNCCLDLPNVGTPPPDWARQARPTFVGLTHDDYSGLDTFEWAFDNLTMFPQCIKQEHGVLPYHTTRQVASANKLAAAGLPVLFTFPGRANGRQDYHYDVTSLVVGPQDASLFRVPESCKNVLCNNERTRIETDTTIGYSS